MGEPPYSLSSILKTGVDLNLINSEVHFGPNDLVNCYQMAIAFSPSYKPKYPLLG